MLRLLLLRHGKAVPGTAIADFERPLDDQGRRDAREAGALIAAEFRPDGIVCSTARRARETLAAVLPHLGTDLEIRMRRALYEAQLPEMPTLLADFGGASATLLAIGHNPLFEQAVGMFAFLDSEERGRHLPAGGLAVLEFPVTSWQDLKPGTAKLTGWFVSHNPNPQSGAARLPER
jgi:phosphohistidine phosphatase